MIIETEEHMSGCTEGDVDRMWLTAENDGEKAALGHILGLLRHGGMIQVGPRCVRIESVKPKEKIPE